MRVTRCDNSTCDNETPGHWVPDVPGWIMVEANEDVDHGQFCSWSCLAAWATERAMEREMPRAD